MKKKRLGGFERIHQAKTRSRKAQIRARALGKKYDGFCLAKQVDPETFRRPLNLSQARVPADCGKQGCSPPKAGTRGNIQAGRF